MQKLNRQEKVLGLVGVIGSVLCIWFSPARADDPMQIYMWVAQEMQIDIDQAMPKILFVEKSELQAAFKEGNHKSYLRWEAEYGKVQAQRILNKYLEGVLGLFVPQTETIYVDAFLSPCRQEAILAHEISHFFQHLTHGVISPGQYGADMEHLVREMEAYQLEKKFVENHCGAPLP